MSDLMASMSTSVDTISPCARTRVITSIPIESGDKSRNGLQRSGPGDYPIDARVPAVRNLSRVARHICNILQIIHIYMNKLFISIAETYFSNLTARLISTFDYRLQD